MFQGSVKAVMQSDGNLILYDARNKGIWFSGTNPNNSSYLLLQNDGNLVIFNQSNTTLWETNTTQVEC